jgi:multidrug efflux pump subunit AcrA (membrane-fusion protein)
VSSSFRDRALGDPPSPLEHIDHLFHQTSRRIWLGVVGLALLLGAGIVWAAVATQSITDDGPAVIVPPQGIFTAGDAQTGVVNSVRVHEGNVVREGEVLGSVLSQAGRLVKVLSPIDGRVIAVEVRAGDTTAGQSPMFRIAPIGRTPVAVMLFPATRIADIAPGQRVAVTVNGVARDKYGQAVGRVQHISPIPISDQRLHQITGDASLANLPAQLGPLREVTIALTRANTPSGLKWTQGSGPPGRLAVGVQAVASVTVSRQTLLGKAFG